ncbi:MAG TPA: hypothetical protein VEY11_01630 [Pyrinomonadaceae bacterium]|nr:hypothetical protein [Pyrinomonadaceae bacterium]
MTADVDQHSTNAGVDQDSTAAEANQDLITSVAETTGRVAAKVSNVIDSLTGALRKGRKG